MIIYKRDIGAGQPLSRTLRGYHYRIALTHSVETQLGLSGSAIVQVTRLAGPVNGPGAAQACTAPIAPGAYANPFAQATGIAPQRIDQGVDYDGNGPIAAIGDAAITHISTAAAIGWPGFYDITYQLDNGPDQGNWVYVVEDITPTPGLHVGEQVRAGQPIATFAYPRTTGSRPDGRSPTPPTRSRSPRSTAATSRDSEPPPATTSARSWPARAPRPETSTTRPVTTAQPSGTTHDRDARHPSRHPQRLPDRPASLRSGEQPRSGLAGIASGRDLGGPESRVLTKLVARAPQR